MKVVAISDTHIRHLKYSIDIPDGDLLIHAGDGTFIGDEYEVKLWMDWFSSFPHKYKICIAGNHDKGFEETPELTRSLVPSNVIYLQDSEVTIDGIRIYGAPWSPTFGNNWAFNRDRGWAIREAWDKIPTGLDILITHGPPFGYGDDTKRGERIGCEDLYQVLMIKTTRYHICGHNHFGHGTYIIRDPITQELKTTVINASICDESYLPTNKPIVFDI